jgi:general secretion pathway protein K
MTDFRKQQGTVLIVTLWTITLLTILVAVIASQNRLTAQTARYHQDELATWAKLTTALNEAEMELMMERMPEPVKEVEVEDLEQLNENPRYRFNGQPLQLHYPQPEGVVVRIYDHAGKINLREISRPRLRALIENRLGEGLDARAKVDAMMAAWGDWLDLNNLAGIDGADTDYYLSLDPPYNPRNGTIETVEEILLIRGFEEVFADVDLDAAFTLYGENELVNLNFATVEAMQLLPGLNDELIEQIVAWREENEFRGNGDVAQIVPAENMAELRPWLNNMKTTNYYTIIVYPETGTEDPEDSEEQKDTATTGFAETIEIVGATDRPRVYKINPYQKIPVRFQAVTQR